MVLQEGCSQEPKTIMRVKLVCPNSPSLGRGRGIFFPVLLLQELSSVTLPGTWHEVGVVDQRSPRTAERQARGNHDPSWLHAASVTSGTHNQVTAHIKRVIHIYIIYNCICFEWFLRMVSFLPVALYNAQLLIPRFALLWFLNFTPSTGPKW